VVIYVLRVYLFLILGLLLMVLLSNFGIILFRIKLFNVGFFGDFEILINVWRFLFLFIVVIIRRRVLLFSFSYISGLFVSNFIILYVRFIFRIL